MSNPDVKNIIKNKIEANGKTLGIFLDDFPVVIQKQILDMDIEETLEYLLFIKQDLPPNIELIDYIKTMLKYIHHIKMSGIREFWIDHIDFKNGK